jgi:hypothetical protein
MRMANQLTRFGLIEECSKLNSGQLDIYRLNIGRFFLSIDALCVIIIIIIITIIWNVFFIKSISKCQDRQTEYWSLTLHSRHTQCLW